MGSVPSYLPRLRTDYQKTSFLHTGSHPDLWQSCGVVTSTEKPMGVGHGTNFQPEDHLSVSDNAPSGGPR